MKEHLLKYLPNRDENSPALVLYDGHKSHVSISLIEWAKSENIVLFVLPPHCSHILQPLDVSCFGPFEVAWNAACHKHLRESGGCLVTRYDVCRMACKVYTSTLTVANITAAFQKCGIYPFNANAISDVQVAPSTTFPRQTSEQATSATSANPSAETFLLEKGGKILENVEKAKKPRNTLSKIVGGKPITEDPIIDKIKMHNSKCPSKSSSKTDSGAKRSQASPTPGSSGLKRQKKVAIIHSDTDLDSDPENTEEGEKCTVCGKIQPDPDKHEFLYRVQWGQCDKCDGWVHLAFCTPVRVLRRGDSFMCPKCEKAPLN